MFLDNGRQLTLGVEEEFQLLCLEALALVLAALTQAFVAPIDPVNRRWNE